MTQIPRLSPLLLIVAVLTVYAQTLWYPFVWDDPEIIEHMRLAARKEGLPGVLAADYGYLHDRPPGYWRPVTMASLWLDDLVSSSPWVFHATSLLFYLLDVLLLYRLALLLLPGGSGALFSALFFAVLPTHTESVAFVSNRHDLLACVFLLTATLAWARDRGAEPRAGALLTGGGGLFLAALSKESALVLPAALLLWDRLWPHPGSRGVRGWWERNRRWLAAWGAAVSAVVLLRTAVFAGGIGQPESLVRGSLEDPLLWGSRMAHYLTMLVFPWRVGIWFGKEQAGLSLPVLLGALSFILLVAATAGKKFARWGLKGGGWALVMLLPVSGIVPIGGSLVAARHVFFASAGICLLAGYLLDRSGFGRERGIRPFLAGTLSCLLLAWSGAASFFQARVWRDDLPLAQRLVRDAPGEAMSHLNLGSALIGAGRIEEGLKSSLRAMELDPDWDRGYVNAGMALAELGRWEESERVFRDAIVRLPRSADLHHNLGVLLDKRGRKGEALEEHRKAALLSPDREWFHNRLAR